MDKRLKKIAELVPTGAKVLDVGTDHGYLPMYLAQSDKIACGIVSDVSRESLQKAQDLIKEQKMEHRLQSRVGSGLSVIEEKDGIDCIVIAGMGGHLIAKILEEDKTLLVETEPKLILQPMQNPEALRNYLLKNGYFIEREALAEENRIYQIIVAGFGESEEYNEMELLFGKSKHHLSAQEKDWYRQLLLGKKKELEKIIAHLLSSDAEDMASIIDERKKQMAQLDTILESL